MELFNILELFFITKKYHQISYHYLHCPSWIYVKCSSDCDFFHFCGHNLNQPSFVLSMIVQYRVIHRWGQFI